VTPAAMSATSVPLAECDAAWPVATSPAIRSDARKKIWSLIAKKNCSGLGQVRANTELFKTREQTINLIISTIDIKN